MKWSPWPLARLCYHLIRQSASERIFVNLLFLLMCVAFGAAVFGLLSLYNAIIHFL